jgi:hypothetical protein
MLSSACRTAATFSTTEFTSKDARTASKKLQRNWLVLKDPNMLRCDVADVKKIKLIASGD